MTGKSTLTSSLPGGFTTAGLPEAEAPGGIHSQSAENKEDHHTKRRLGWEQSDQALQMARPISAGMINLGHVGARVDAALGILWQCNLKTLFDLLEDRFILLAAHERDGKTLGTKAAGATDTVKV